MLLLKIYSHWLRIRPLGGGFVPSSIMWFLLQSLWKGENIIWNHCSENFVSCNSDIARTSQIKCIALTCPHIPIQWQVSIKRLRFHCLVVSWEPFRLKPIDDIKNLHIAIKEKDRNATWVFFYSPTISNSSQQPALYIIFYHLILFIVRKCFAIFL